MPWLAGVALAIGLVGVAAVLAVIEAGGGVALVASGRLVVLPRTPVAVVGGAAGVDNGPVVAATGGRLGALVCAGGSGTVGAGAGGAGTVAAVGGGFGETGALGFAGEGGGDEAVVTVTPSGFAESLPHG